MTFYETLRDRHCAEGEHDVSTLWKVVHALWFAGGGACFVAGTAILFWPAWAESGTASAVCYTVGSACFLAVDSLEFVTYTQESKWVRINIMCSWVGSMLYLVGSVGFLPAVYDWDDQVGIQGFILGSFAIGMSELWKTHRIGSDEIGFSMNVLLGSWDKMTQAGVEMGACIGAWCFFVGTIIYWHSLNSQNTPVAPDYRVVLWIWLIGSCFFTAGGVILGWRHVCGY